MGRGPDSSEVLSVLKRYAPVWLVHLPGLVEHVELEQLRHQVEGATPERMVRELC